MEFDDDDSPKVDASAVEVDGLSTDHEGGPPGPSSGAAPAVPVPVPVPPPPPPALEFATMRLQLALPASLFRCLAFAFTLADGVFMFESVPTTPDKELALVDCGAIKLAIGVLSMSCSSSCG